MPSYKKWITNLLVVAVAVVFCGGPEFARAQQPETAQAPVPTQQQDAPTASQQQDAPAASQQQDEPAATQQQPATTPDTEQTQQQVRPGVVDPSAGPLRPVPSQPLPDAPSTTTTQQQQQQQQRPRVQQPAGVGAAPAARTTGGAASKPAGNAIAPAKQNQRRALVLKLGLIGGAAIALGTVIALSKGTKSIPPGAAQ